jgi:4-diphosphocytidyl-2-C-methyl-D-erythritol kinase
LTPTVLAPAKINLALHVTGQRADGYHLLDSLVVFTEFGDKLAFEAAKTDELIIDGPFAHVLTSEYPASNLVSKARTMLRQYGVSLGYLCPPVQICLTKNLPVASGIGGGSSDAAAALLGLGRFWKIDISLAALSDIGLKLGADVPMCLIGKPLFARGVGDEIVPVSPFPALHLVLVNPGVAVSTPEVFQRLESKTNSPLAAYPRPASVEDFCNWLSKQRNDLQAPAVAIQPVIAESLDALKHSGAILARMSGSGATCFGIFADAQSGEKAANAVGNANPDWFVVATKTGAA